MAVGAEDAEPLVPKPNVEPDKEGVRWSPSFAVALKGATHAAYTRSKAATRDGRW